VETLLDFFDRYVRGPAQALVYDDGFRRWVYSHDQLRATAAAFAARLAGAGVQPGERVMIWGESRPEWVAVFWGCVLRGVAVVPVDASASRELIGRILNVAGPRGIIVGDAVQPGPLPSSLLVWRLSEIDWNGTSASLPGVPATRETVAEIVFTSGTTGEPKGVVITHQNILANITPIEHEVAAYRRYLWPFRPIRFLGLLPLSHMFGQALTVFFPPLVGAAAVFMKGYNPDRIIEMARRHRITLIVTVPRVLELLRNRVQHVAPSLAAPFPAARALAARMWHGRGARRLLGWRCCGFVVGGAPLDEELEAFWRGLGFAVVQGYGLTETAPIIAWNHPFRIQPGTVGRPIAGVDVRLAPDGEILVKGPVVTPGYVGASEEDTRTAFEDGWLRTGDIGAFDGSGHLLIRGRKKDLIATAEGLKVFPEDVERILEHVAGVREAAVIGRRADHAERVHAVLALDAGVDPEAVLRDVNAQLESHQRIQSFSVWTGDPLPRTEPMRKLKRYAIRRWVEEGEQAAVTPAPAPHDDIERLLSRYAKGRALEPAMTLDELGLTSLDKVELMMSLEEEGRMTVSEAAIAEARTVSDLRRLVEQGAGLGVSAEAFPFPSWNRRRAVRFIRNISQPTWVLPLAGMFLRLRVEGREHLRALSGPVIFAANHQSHFDTPAILSALPARWRRAIMVAMAKEYFEAHFFPERHTLPDRVMSSAIYYLVALFFGAFPLPQQEPGARETLRYIGDVVTDGFSILIFPEGLRTERGEINAFQPGVGLLGSKLRLPVVPVRLEGVDRVLHHTWRWPRRGTVRITFGAPLRLSGDDYVTLARQVQDAVIALQPAGA